MELLTKENILAAEDLTFEHIEVPEWGGVVRVRTMTAGERDRWETALLDEKGEVREQDIRARLVSLTAVDGEGKRMFDDGDITALSAKSAAAMDRVFAAASKLNGLSAADVEELAKN